MKTLTDQDRHEAETILAEIRRRPAYILACVWLERVALARPEPFGKPDQIPNGWVTVDRVVNILHAHFGGHVHEETMLAALADKGFAVRDSRRGAETNLAEAVLLDAWQSTDFGKRPPRSLTEFSDPTDAQKGLR